MLWNGTHGGVWFATCSEMKSHMRQWAWRPCPVLLEWKPGSIKCPVSIRVFCSSHPNLNKSSYSFGQRHFHLSGEVILEYKSMQVTTQHRNHKFWLNSSSESPVAWWRERRGWNLFGTRHPHPRSGIQVAFVFLHKWTCWMRTNICNSYTFGDERRCVCRLRDDVSWINTLSPSVTEKYMPVTLEVSIVGMKRPQATSGSPCTWKVLPLWTCS